MCLRNSQRLATLVLLFVVSTTVRAEEACCDHATWTIRAGAIFLDRSQPDNGLLSFELGGPPPALVSAQDFNFDFEPGFEMGAIRHGVLDTDVALEVRYLEVDNWAATTPPATTTFPVFNYATGFFFGPPGSAITGTYEAELQSIEVNARRQVGDYIQVLVGLRHVQLDEALTLTETLGGGPGIASTAARNNLIGAQLGADMALFSRERFSLEALVKAGIYANSASNNTAVTLGGVPALPGSTAGANEAAFLGEFGVTGLYQLTDCLSLRASYQILWTDGIATASEQFAVSDPAAGTANINNTDSPYYHGAFVGLQFEK